MLDALFAHWSNGTIRQFTEIHGSLKTRNIVKHNYQTIRILDRASRLGFIEKVERGRYKSNVEPGEFRVFDYLQNLRHRSEIARGRIGGALWSSHDMYFLGMPENVFADKEGNYVLQILNIRLAELFNAYKALAMEMKTRKEGHSEEELSGLPRTVIRQLLLELVPYYLGSRAGIDGDGLTEDELNIALPKMIESLPEHIEDDEGWSASTLKDIISENLTVINKLECIHTKKMKKAQSENENLEDREDITSEAKNLDFALIVTGPEHLIDSEGFAQREIREEIVQHGKEDESPFYLASLLLDYKREEVLKALTIQGQTYLGRERCKKIHDAYEKLFASNWLAEVITDWYTRNQLKEKSFSKSERSMIDECIKKFVKNFGIKNLITYLAFGKTPWPFNHPTAEKEKAVHQFFPEVPEENIHEWLIEGTELQEDFAKKAWERWEKAKPSICRKDT